MFTVSYHLINDDWRFTLRRPGFVRSITPEIAVGSTGKYILRFRDNSPAVCSFDVKRFIGNAPEKWIASEQSVIQKILEIIPADLADIYLPPKFRHLTGSNNQVVLFHNILLIDVV